jgi:ATP-binding cassette subfamily B protein
MLFVTSWRLTVLALAVVPAVVGGAVVYGRAVRKVSRQVQDALARSTEVAEETLSGIRTVRAFAREEAEARRYGDAVQESFRLARRRAAMGAAFGGGMAFAGYGAVALVLWYGGSLLVAGRMTVGELTSFVLYTFTVAFGLGALSGVWEDLVKALGAGERVFELLDRQPRVASGGIRPPDVVGTVRFEEAGFAYPARPDAPVLRGVNLELRRGEVTALVGPSGAGKSTVAALLSRFYDPQEGALRLDGTDLRELDASWLREQVGVVSQEPILFATTIAHNIRYGRESATDAQVEAAARAAHAHMFISSFPDGYYTLVGERGVRLSGGQKQRVAIARALLKDPRVLVLDEATSALDAESEHLVQEALRTLMAGRTTLVIAHRLSTVKEADRVVVMDRGRIVQSGRHQDLVAEEGIYRQLVARQFAG